MNWKDPEIAARLRELWDEGHSCGAIARIIGNGVTRNAVIGAVSRGNFPRRVSMHRLPTRGISKHQLASRKKPAPPQKGKPFVLHDRVLGQPKISAAPTPIPPPAETDIARVSFNELNEDGQRHCKWPCFDAAPHPSHPAFCGLKPKPGIP
jgi:GcrA cell cycle regulator